MTTRRRRAVDGGNELSDNNTSIEQDGVVKEPKGAIPVVTESLEDEITQTLGSDSEPNRKPGSPLKNRAGDDDEKLRHRRHHRHPRESRTNIRKSFKQSKRLIFFLGALLGIVLAWYFAAAQEFVTLETFNDLNLDALSEFVEDVKGKLPVGMLNDAKEILGNESSLYKREAFAVGRHMYKEGLRAKHPVVMVPGVISTGLESWSTTDTQDCGCEQYFRKRLWGSFNMLRAMFLDKTCWLKHIMLDPNTGLDPKGYKLRAAQGLEAADFFVAGYWIWNKILENLAVITYDPNLMSSAAYDWRLSYMDLERRDAYFTKVKSTIEQHKQKTGEKTVLASHSMGSQVVFFFFKWVEATGELYGNGGRNWVNEHIEAFVDISGSSLGTPKSIVALLSGEMRDTVQLNALAVYGLEKFFSRYERATLLRTFPGLASMLPKGGEAVWGSMDHAIDDADNQTISYGNFIRFLNNDSPLTAKNLTIPESIEFLFSQAPQWFKDRVDINYSHGIARTRAEVEANNQDYRKWVNPLESALPNAPDLKIYCFYGVGKPTERAYLYQEEKAKSTIRLNVSIAAAAVDYGDPVVMGEGDGTVSLITHSMCHRWRDPGSKFNPGNSKVTIVEMPHEPERFDVRGGPKTAEHVDVLGRAELNELVLKVAAGLGHTIEDRFVSKLKDYARNIDLGED
ncbi:Lecithin:cholesterol acyltransferase-domain-containing protein [Dipodascopsis uninucleata]